MNAPRSMLNITYIKLQFKARMHALLYAHFEEAYFQDSSKIFFRISTINELVNIFIINLTKFTFSNSLELPIFSTSHFAPPKTQKRKLKHTHTYIYIYIPMYVCMSVNCCVRISFIYYFPKTTHLTSVIIRQTCQRFALRHLHSIAVTTMWGC